MVDVLKEFRADGTLYYLGFPNKKMNCSPYVFSTLGLNNEMKELGEILDLLSSHFEQVRNLKSRATKISPIHLKSPYKTHSHSSVKRIPRYDTGGEMYYIRPPKLTCGLRELPELMLRR